jgi:hypothetical protein
MFKFIAYASIAITSQLTHVAAMEGDGLGESRNGRNYVTILMSQGPYPDSATSWLITDGRNDDDKKRGGEISAPTPAESSLRWLHIPPSFGDQQISSRVERLSDGSSRIVLAFTDPTSIASID